MFLELLVAGLCCMPHVGGFCCCHWLFDWRFDEFDAIRFAYFSLLRRKGFLGGGGSKFRQIKFSSPKNIQLFNQFSGFSDSFFIAYIILCTFWGSSLI